MKWILLSYGIGFLVWTMIVFFIGFKEGKMAGKHAQRLEDWTSGKNRPQV